MLPNQSVDERKDISKVWNRMVYEETTMAGFLTTVGLLNPGLQQVTLSRSLFPKEGIFPAYVCESFESFAITRNIFIIDLKNGASSTWRFDKMFLFSSDAERLQEKNWYPLLSLTIQDAVKLFSYKNLAYNCLGGDTYNIAVVKIADDQYRIRYFGFDFSSKCERINEMPNGQREVGPLNQVRIRQFFYCIIDQIFAREFGRGRYDDDRAGIQAMLHQMRDRLIQRCAALAIREVQQAQFANAFPTSLPLACF